MKIRLAESKLKEIVSESVKSVLTELDWRTYNSAYNKAMERASATRNPFSKKRDEKRGIDFFTAQRKAYTDNYDLEGFDTTPEGENANVMSYIKKDYDSYKQQGFSEIDIERWLKDEYGKNYDMFKKYYGKYKLTNGELKKIARRYDDNTNYRNGNQEYKSGQGWVNKE